MTVRKRLGRTWLGVCGVLVSLASVPGVAHGQSRVPPDSAAPPDSTAPRAWPVNPDAAPTPFGPGERLEYKLKLGIFPVGHGFMEVEGIDTVRGSPSYHVSMGLKGGLGPAKVDDKYGTWFDVVTLASHRFIQDIHEVRYKSYRHYEMLPDEGRWDRRDNDESGPLGSMLPLDDIAFIYYIRTLDLEVGKTYTLNRYFKEEGNPVIIDVVRRDERKVGAGTFKTIVVKPTIRTKGLFGEGGNAEIHFTDDERRLLVYMRTEIPVIGSMTLHLEKISEGLPLNPESRAAAEAWRAAGDSVVGSGAPGR